MSLSDEDLDRAQAVPEEELAARCGHECLSPPEHDGPHFYGYRGGPWTHEWLVDELRRLRGQSAEYLLDTRAGVALAHSAWTEGASHTLQAIREHQDGDAFVLMRNPYSAPLLRKIRDEGGGEKVSFDTAEVERKLASRMAGLDEPADEPCIGDCGRTTNGWFPDGTHGPGLYCGWCEAVPGEVDG